MKKIVAAIAMALGSSMIMAAPTACKVVTQGPGGLTDQLFRIAEKHNPDFQVTYRISGYNVTQIDLLEQDKSYMMLSPPVFFSKQNPRPNPPLEMVKVFSSSNAAIVTGKDLTIKDFADKKLNVGIPAFAQYSHVLALTLQQKNPNINIIPVPAKDVPAILKSGDLDAYIHTEPTVDTFVNMNIGFKKMVVVKPDVPTDFNGIKTQSLHFSSIWVHKDATPEQKEHVLKCVGKLEKNAAFLAEIEKTGSTSRLGLPTSNKDKYLSDFISMLRKFDL
jgi:hypothetical protein